VRGLVPERAQVGREVDPDHRARHAAAEAAEHEDLEAAGGGGVAGERQRVGVVRVDGRRGVAEDGLGHAADDMYVYNVTVFYVKMTANSTKFSSFPTNSQQSLVLFQRTLNEFLSQRIIVVYPRISVLLNIFYFFLHVFHFFPNIVYFFLNAASCFLNVI
jgi:hypothetical protein